MSDYYYSLFTLILNIFASFKSASSQAQNRLMRKIICGCICITATTILNGHVKNQVSIYAFVKLKNCLDSLRKVRNVINCRSQYLRKCNKSHVVILVFRWHTTPKTNMRIEDRLADWFKFKSFESFSIEAYNYDEWQTDWMQLYIFISLLQKNNIYELLIY